MPVNTRKRSELIDKIDLSGQVPGDGDAPRSIAINWTSAFRREVVLLEGAKDCLWERTHSSAALSNEQSTFGVRCPLHRFGHALTTRAI